MAGSGENNPDVQSAEDLCIVDELLASAYNAKIQAKIEMRNKVQLIRRRMKALEEVVLNALPEFASKIGKISDSIRVNTDKPLKAKHSEIAAEVPPPSVSSAPLIPYTIDNSSEIENRDSSGQYDHPKTINPWVKDPTDFRKKSHPPSSLRFQSTPMNEWKMVASR
ncbi:unnamed protein product [Orchesella dallaii]|uniref:Uncharacterized protein n=1 Tax=Orchesella dallaii TaxID=48710 RepID=A0ABP1Q2V5_9HEXA